MKKNIFQILFILLLAAILSVTLFFISGCEVLKKKYQRTSDSTAVKKVDSVYVTKVEDGKRYDSSWWREIINLLPKGSDTIISNTTVPVNNYYPAQIIREGGTITKEWLQRYMDSVVLSKKDTATVRAVEVSKSKETKVFNIWQIIGLAAGVSLVIVLLSKLKIGIR